MWDELLKQVKRVLYDCGVMSTVICTYVIRQPDSIFVQYAQNYLKNELLPLRVKKQVWISISRKWVKNAYRS